MFTISQPGLPHAATIDPGALTDDFGNANGQGVAPVPFP
jgi:hypothetical protein